MSAAIQVHALETRPGGNWERLLAGYPEAGVFHSAAWLRVLQRTYGHELFYLEAAFGAGRPLLVPLSEVRSRLTGVRGVSLPFTDVCPPLGAAPESAPVVETLLEFGRTRQWTHVELRGAAALLVDSTPSITYCAHRLDLRPGAARVKESFASSARRAWSKAERLGIRVEIGTSVAAMQAFSELHTMTRRRHGAPPQPPEFFCHLREELAHEQLGFIAVGFAGEVPISAAVFLQRGKSAVYKFGASNETQHTLRGNFAVMGQALLHLAEGGCEEVHFGRTSADNAGLRRFKLLWGSVAEPLHYHRFCVSTGECLTSPDRTSGLHTELFRRLPARVNHWAGRLLYPHLD